MTSDKWITLNWSKLETAAKNVSQGHHLWQDLLNHCLLDFLQKEQVEQIIKDGYAQFYIVRIMLNQWRSVTSPFYKLYRSNSHLSVEESNLSEWYHPDEIEPDWDLDKVNVILDHMEEDRKGAGWYHKKLIDLYAETPNYKRLAQMTGISRTSISKSVNRARDEIKKKYYG